jgi:hypothetical protein
MLMFRQSTYGQKLHISFKMTDFIHFFISKIYILIKLYLRAVMLNARAFGTRWQKRAPSLSILHIFSN